MSYLLFLGSRLYRLCGAMLLVIVSIALPVGGADVPLSDSTVADNAMARLRDRTLSYFSPVQGVITASDGSSVQVRLDGGDTVREGMRLSVFRTGAPFHHPLTKEFVGNTEEYVGKVEVREAAGEEGTYRCRVVGGTVAEGYRVRITASRIGLAFFQDRKADWAVSESFYTSLKESGRFEILETYTSSYEAEHLSRLGRELQAEAVLMLSTPADSDKSLLHVQLFWAEDGREFARLEESLGKGDVAAALPLDEFITTSLADKEPWGSYTLDAGQLIAIGDVDQNGRRELVVSDGHTLTVYDMGKELRELWSIRGKPDRRHLSVDVLDVNSNGRAEIFVTSVINESAPDSDEIVTGAGRSTVRSTIIEYSREGGYEVTHDDIPSFFRVLGDRLLMQKFSQRSIFGGSVHEARWQDGQYQPGKELSLPREVTIYGFAYVDWKNDGKLHVISYDDQGFLHLYDERGEQLWKSKRTYGEFDLSFQEKRDSVINPAVKWTVRGRIAAVRSEKGQEVLVVHRMPVLARVPGLGAKGGEVYSLWWDGSFMDEKLILDRVTGSVTDYRVEGNRLYLMARGDMFALMKNAATGEFSRQSRIYYYNFRDK